MSQDNSGWRRLLSKWWVLSLSYFVVYGGFQLLRPGRTWVDAVIGAAIYAAWMTGWQVRRRRRDSRAVGAKADELPQLERRMMRGEVPDDPAERQAMRKLAERRTAKLRRGAKWALPLLGFLWLAFAVLSLARGDLGTGLVWLAAGAVMLGVIFWSRQRVLGRLDRAERRLSAADRGRGRIA
jgi:Flp pilus assembly protein TadB